MEDQTSTIPWNTPVLWQEANASLGQSVVQHRHLLSASRRLANSIRNRLLSIFPVMDFLCRQTCPDCADNCCRRAWVWADFKDLLFLHLAHIAVPGRQLLGRRGEHCRYESPRGCQLDRLQRPFVCSWYICPAQTRILQTMPIEQRRLTAILQQIKDERRTMEGQFIQAVFR